MILLRLARLLDRLSFAMKRAADKAYRVHFRREHRRAAREAQRREDERTRRDELAIAELIGETPRHRQRVGAPHLRER